jgi:hypothetical protein
MTLSSFNQEQPVLFGTGIGDVILFVNHFKVNWKKNFTNL